jgi:hypothetical protein
VPHDLPGDQDRLTDTIRDRSFRTEDAGRVNAVVLSWLSSLLAAGANPIVAEAAAANAPASGIAIEVTGDCPTREAVMAALLPVLGVEPPRPLREPPRVSDAGDRFEVTALGQSQEYVDTARNCVERARVAAVFIVLADGHR